MCSLIFIEISLNKTPQRGFLPLKDASLAAVHEAVLLWAQHVGISQLFCHQVGSAGDVSRRLA